MPLFFCKYFSSYPSLYCIGISHNERAMKKFKNPGKFTDFFLGPSFYDRSILKQPNIHGEAPVRWGW
jgi:hypothetical protein